MIDKSSLIHDFNKALKIWNEIGESDPRYILAELNKFLGEIEAGHYDFRGGRVSGEKLIKRDALRNYLHDIWVEHHNYKMGWPDDHQVETMCDKVIDVVKLINKKILDGKFDGDSIEEIRYEWNDEAQEFAYKFKKESQ